MIPATTSDLEALLGEVDRQTDEVRELLAPLSEEALNWRSGPDRWSVGGHVAHLCMINPPYLDSLEACAVRARARGLLGEGPYRHPWTGRLFVREMEPPPKRRMKTMKRMVPDPRLEGGQVMARFEEVQARLARRIEGARGLDLGRARFSSPYFALLRMSLGTGFGTLLAHNRRHIWLLREAMSAPGFPGS